MEDDPAYRVYLMDGVRPQRWYENRPGRWIADLEADAWAPAPGQAAVCYTGEVVIGGGRLGEPLDAVVEQVRETGRLIFLRGMVVQGLNDEHIVASFSGTIRKASQDKR